MSIQLLHEEIGICSNIYCDSYKSYEKYSAEDILRREDGKEFMTCYDCHQRIYFEDM